MRLIARTARLAAAVAATFGIIAIGGWAGGVFRVARAAPGAPPRTRIADDYPRRSEPGEIRIGDALAVNGQRMQLSAFTTRDPPARVVQFYEEAFRQRRLIPVAVSQERFGHVSVFDPDDGLQRSVTAVPERSGHTLVLLGVTDPREFAARRDASAASYPVPQEHRAFVGYDSEDGPVRGQSGQFVSTLSGAEVANFYRAELAARGFLERPESSPGLLAFAKGTEQVSVALQALAEARGAAVFVTHIAGAP